MKGYSSHTNSFVNIRNERFLVKFHFMNLQGIQFMTYERSAKIIYRNPQSQQQELVSAFEKEDILKWWMFDASAEDPQHTEPPSKIN
jgi:catalase